MALILSQGFTLATRQLKPVVPPSSSSSRNNHVPGQIHFRAAFTISNKIQTTLRRSADYKPPIWSFECIQSLKSEYQREPYSTKVAQLKEDVRFMFEERQADGDDLFHQLELIDTLQRLGLSYHFENEVETILERLHDNIQGNHGLKSISNSLYATSIAFRLLRQHGKYVPQENFNRFIDKNGEFKSCLSKDYKGLLNLYEASFLSMKGENVLDEAKKFSEKHLKEYVELKGSKDPYLSLLVSHALEFPLHWRMRRMEARKFIDIYHQNPEMNSAVLDLAKMDFNLVQANFQEDLKHASRWWKRTGLGENMEFIRDRIVECFLWTIGIFHPQYGYCRRMVTQVIALITALDDVYDIHGTLDELELFTNAVERWDINTIEELPDYMKLCFFALYNSENGMASDVLSKQGLNTLPYTKKLWAEFCKAALLEATWYHNGYTPTLQEYMDNAVTSVGAPLVLCQAYAFVAAPMTREGLESFDKEYPNILKISSIIVRLANDLETSEDEMERGDSPKSIQCYMHETGVSREEAREYIWNLIDITWKDMNKHQMFENSFFSRTLVEAAINFSRMSQFVYMYGDGHSSQDNVTRNRILDLLVKPVV